MSLSRRDFVRRLGLGGASLASASFIVGRGHEDLMALGAEEFATGAPQATMATDRIRISGNENLRGPSPKVIEVLKRHPSKDLGFGYPVPSLAEFVATIAEAYDARPENVITGTASGIILRAATRAYVTPSKHLVTGDPSFLSPVNTAQRIGGSVKALPLDSKLFLDLDAMVDASRGAGMVFICNPNNPTSTLHPLSDIEIAVREIKQRSPETAILIDEAYIEYSTAPGVGSGVQLALDLPDVFITRTFSKAHGLAGMRMGYALGQPATVTKIREAWGLGSINELQAVAGIASLKDTAHMEWERQENKRVRDWTLSQFKGMGFDAPDSQTNFVFVNIGRSAAEFRDACAQHGVEVGRDFPPMEKTHTRISIGTMDHMERAMRVFRQVLERTSI